MARGDEQRYKNWLDDHVKKLFGCFWGPSFGQELIDAEQIRTYQGMARGLHEARAPLVFRMTPRGPWANQLYNSLIAIRDEPKKHLQIGGEFYQPDLSDRARARV